MKLAFYLAAAVMIAVALALLLLPLLRHGRQTGRPRGLFALMLCIALALPLIAAGLYVRLGTPVTLNGVQTQADTAMDIDKALDELRAHLATDPNDAQGWMLLAQAANEMQQSEQARDAYDHVLTLTPNNTEAMVGWANADSMLRPDHHIQDRARALLLQAVKLAPDNQRGLWLLGISDFQEGRFADAAATWRLLQPQLQPGSTVAQAVAQQIAAADARASGSAPASSSTAQSAPTNAASSAPGLTIQVALSPALKDKVSPGDALFVFARAEQGPPMPLAVARLDASRLPTSVTLTDAMSMVPTMKLSSVTHALVEARISHSGQPIAQPGDLEGSAGVVDIPSATPIKLVIDKVQR